MTSPSLVLQHSTAWLPAPIPSAGTPYHKLCPPKSHKPLLMPASHPETPPGHSSTHITRLCHCHLLHPSFLLLPQLLHMSNTPHPSNASPGAKGCLGRLGTAIQSVLARAGVCTSSCQVLALAKRMDIAPPRAGLPPEHSTERPTRGKCFVKMLHLYP